MDCSCEHATLQSPNRVTHFREYLYTFTNFSCSSRKCCRKLQSQSKTTPRWRKLYAHWNESSASTSPFRRHRICSRSWLILWMHCAFCRRLALLSLPSVYLLAPWPLSGSRKLRHFGGATFSPNCICSCNSTFARAPAASITPRRVLCAAAAEMPSAKSCTRRRHPAAGKETSARMRPVVSVAASIAALEYDLVDAQYR